MSWKVPSSKLPYNIGGSGGPPPEDFENQECSRSYLRSSCTIIYTFFQTFSGTVSRILYVVSVSIMLTCLCNVEPLTTHFYIVTLESTGVHIPLLFLKLKENVGTLENHLNEAVLTCTHNLLFR